MVQITPTITLLSRLTMSLRCFLTGARRAIAGIMLLSPAALLLAVHLTRIAAWKCGIGPISGTISYVIALPSDTTGVDNCCIEHDTLIDDYHVAREEADRIFCQCLSDKSGWYARNVVKPLFCTAVMLYTKLFEREAVKAVNGTAYEHVETP